MLFDIKGNKAKNIKEKHFKSEKDLQKLFEVNIKEFVNLEFIETEFTVSDFRLDTVAFDSEANAFIIIEYKNKKNASVIDQGYTYLSTMFNHKADFVLSYNKKFNTNKYIDDFDWSQSKVMFISNNFTKYQTNSINFKDLPIELWKIKYYNNDTVSLEQIVSSNSTGSIKAIAPNIDININQEFSKETKSYSEEELLINTSDEIVDIYNDLKDFITSINDNILVKPTKLYVGFNLNRKSIISIKLQKKSLILWINTSPSKIDDPKKLVRDVSSIGHQGNGDSEIKIDSDENIGYIEDIIKKSIKSLE